KNEDLSKAEGCTSYIYDSSDTLISLQVLEFKANLLEAVEELRFRRDVEIQYEEQVKKLVVEKQELEWQKESLQNQSDILTKEHTEAVVALKKKFQIRMSAMEEDKGKYQLVAESKEKEINGLKEELKALQLSKYSLQKKVSELEQKLQLQALAKDNQLSQFSEIEKRYANIIRQFGLLKQTHEKLEQNAVYEAIRLNKKLTVVNKNHENTIGNLKQELKKTTTDLIRSKVTSQTRVGEENIHLKVKEQQLQETKRKLQMETDLNKKLAKENLSLRNEKQEIMNSLQHVQQLLHCQTQAISRMETQLNDLRMKKQAIEQDNELLRDKEKEKEIKFLNLMEEHENSKESWKQEVQKVALKDKIQEVQRELELIKEAYDHLHELHNK
uniref:Coiled-coil domain containing 73 n=1 Tax=Latimeria chalumnae TaxID=7897 RepID=H3BB36_LATCH